MFFFFILITNDQKKGKTTIKQEKVQNYYYITLLYSSRAYVNNSLRFDQFISNTQEIIDIEWLFELICMFFCLCILITNDQENNRF